MVNFKAYAIGAAGVATSAFGFVAWTSYLFAGTGAAKLICFSLIILGAIIAFIGGLHVDNNAEASAEAPAEAPAEETARDYFYSILAGSSTAALLFGLFVAVKTLAALVHPEAQPFLVPILAYAAVMLVIAAGGLAGLVVVYKNYYKALA